MPYARPIDKLHSYLAIDCQLAISERCRNKDPQDGSQLLSLPEASRDRDVVYISHCLDLLTQLVLAITKQHLFAQLRIACIRGPRAKSVR